MDCVKIPSKPNGHTCEKCGGKLYVIRGGTKKPAPGLVVRYRNCRNKTCSRYLKFHTPTEERRARR